MFDIGRKVGYYNCKNLVWVLYLNLITTIDLLVVGMWPHSSWTCGEPENLYWYKGSNTRRTFHEMSWVRDLPKGSKAIEDKMLIAIEHEDSEEKINRPRSSLGVILTISKHPRHVPLALGPRKISPF